MTTRQSQSPPPSEIRAARRSAGLTQRESAELIYASDRDWRRWEAGDTRMHPAFWDLYRSKIGSLNDGE